MLPAVGQPKKTRPEKAVKYIPKSVATGIGFKFFQNRYHFPNRLLNRFWYRFSVILSPQNLSRKAKHGEDGNSLFE
jgi:hypothetical protein